MSLRIDDATVVDPAPGGARVLEEAHVHVAEGTIQSLEAPEADAERIVDADGDLLLPGLVNAHGHAPMTLLRGYADDLELDDWLNDRIWPVEAHLTAEAVNAGARLACLEQIEAGITTFADMYLFEAEVANAAEEAGLACLAGASIVDQTTAEGSPEEVLAHTRQLLAEHPPGEGRVRASLAPHAVYTCSPDTLSRVAQIAEDAGAKIQTHVAETRSEVYEAEAEHGVRPVELLDEAGLLSEDALLAHGGWLTKQEVRAIGEADASLIHCPTANQKLATGGYTPVPELLTAGARVGLGTDGPASNNRIDVLDEAKRAALLHKHHRWQAEVLPAEQALAMATRIGAEALGFEHAGRLSEGAWADLILLDTDQAHLAPMHDPVSQAIYAARAGDVRTTIAGGEVVYHEGEHERLPAEEILGEARQAAAELVSKATS